MNDTQYLSRNAIHDVRRFDRKRVTAEVISCPGQLWDDAYSAVQINVDGFESPYVLTLALRAVGYRALSEQSDPFAIYSAIARAVNDANIAVEVRTRAQID